MDIGDAVLLLEKKAWVARAGWNGKNMHLYHVDDGEVAGYAPHVVMVTANGDHVPWLCSQSDLLAKDWVDVTVHVEPLT